MISYLLLICVLLLALIYLVYLTGKEKVPKKSNIIFIFSPSIIVSAILFFSIGTVSPIDTKKVEYTAKSLRHYLKWKELVVRDTVRTEVEHREYYTMVYKTGDGNTREFEISELTYNYFIKLWGKNAEGVRDSLSSYFILETEWDRDPSHALIYTRLETFTNYFKSSLDMYSLEPISKKDLCSHFEIYDRARVDLVNAGNTVEPRQPLYYGIDLPDSLSRRLSNISAIDRNFRPIICIWYGAGEDHCKKIITHQKHYWQGGKDNEVVFCVGLNNRTDNEIIWSGSFSWSTRADFEKYVIDNSLKSGEKFNIETYADKLIEGYSKGLWIPRDFEDYQILKIPFGNFVILSTAFLIFIANIIVISLLIYKGERGKKMVKKED